MGMTFISPFPDTGVKPDARRKTVEGQRGFVSMAHSWVRVGSAIFDVMHF